MVYESIKNFNHSRLLRVLKDTLTHAPGPGTSNDWSEQQNLTQSGNIYNSSLVKLQYLWLTLAALLSFHVTWFKVLKLWKPCTITFARKKNLSLVPLIAGLGSRQHLTKKKKKSQYHINLPPEKSAILTYFEKQTLLLHNVYFFNNWTRPINILQLKKSHPNKRKILKDHCPWQIQLG